MKRKSGVGLVKNVVTDKLFYSWGKRKASICLGACEHLSYSVQHRNNGEARLGRRRQKRGEPRTLSARDNWHVQSTMLGPWKSAEGPEYGNRPEEKENG